MGMHFQCISAKILDSLEIHKSLLILLTSLDTILGIRKIRGIQELSYTPLRPRRRVSMSAFKVAVGRYQKSQNLKEHVFKTGLLVVRQPWGIPPLIFFEYFEDRGTTRLCHGPHAPINVRRDEICRSGKSLTPMFPMHGK